MTLHCWIKDDWHIGQETEEDGTKLESVVQVCDECKELYMIE